VAVYCAVTSDLTQQEAILLAPALGVASLLSIGSGVGQIWYQRGPAEVALEHWESARGMRREVRMLPMLAPVHGGVVAGLTLRL